MFSWPLADYKHIPESISCVYKITHTSTDREYIGRSINLKDRARKHWQELKSNTHKNPKFIHLSNKYGNDFSISIVVVGGHDYCKEIEGKLLSMILLKESLNCHKNNEGGWLGQEWSIKSRNKLSLTHRGKKFSLESKAKAAATREVSESWHRHMEKMKTPEFKKAAITAAAQPEARKKAVATRRKNYGSDFFAGSRAKQIENARKRLFACLDWAVSSKTSRSAAIKKFGCSWGSLKKFQAEWEAINGPLTIPLRASGPREKGV